jgi:hypothetical protein
MGMELEALAIVLDDVSWQQSTIDWKSERDSVFLNVFGVRFWCKREPEAIGR